MNYIETRLLANTQFIPAEAQELFDRVVFLMPTGKWIALIFGLITLYFFRMVLLTSFRYLKKVNSIFGEKTFLQFFFRLELEVSASWALTALGGMIFIEFLALNESLSKYLILFLKLIIAFNLIRIFYLAADALGSKIHALARTTESQINVQLAPLITKSMKVLVVIVGALIVSENLGIKVTPILAGLGIGGVALAFAAQDTVANVFGTTTILLDKPFKLGDRIKIGDTEGFVEEVGFRSTRIRTLYNSLVTLSNAYVAKEKIDNLTDRNGVIRFRTIIGVTYDANPKKIAHFAQSLKYRLFQDETVDRNRISISFNGFGDSSLNVLVNFHYQIRFDQDEMLRNQSYFEIIYELIKEANLDFAFPTRTMIIHQPGPSLPG